MEDNKVLQDESSNKISYPYVYAKYVSVSGPHAHVFTEDGEHFFTMNEKLKQAYPDAEFGTYIWVQRKFETTMFASCIFPNTSPYFSYKTFASAYKPKDIVSLPVKSAAANSLSVLIGPNAYLNVPRSEFGSSIDYSSYKEGKIYKFQVVSIQQNEGKFEIRIRPVSLSEFDNASASAYWIPSEDEIENQLVIPSQTLARLKTEYSNIRKFEEVLGKEVNNPNLREFVIKRYKEVLADHTLVSFKSNSGSYINVDLGFKDINGVPMHADLKRNGETGPFYLTQIAAADPSREMERFVYVDDWKAVTDELSALALEENWNFVNEKRGAGYLLKQYLRFNFYKARLDGEVYEEGENAVFNTGLVDHQYDSIFCFLRPNRNLNDTHKHKYEIGYFACRGKGQNGKELNRLFAKFPKAPAYINSAQYQNIYFDTAKDLSCDYEHILTDNLKRLPFEYVTHSLSYDEKIQELLRSGAPFKEYEQYIIERPELLRTLQNGLKSAVEDTIKRCEWNYKTAIPIYYSKTNSISLLLPLSLVGKKTDADCALVIERLANGNYQGQTILTLDMAYQDARQICRPDSDWLTVDAIEETGEEEEGE